MEKRNKNLQIKHLYSSQIRILDKKKCFEEINNLRTYFAQLTLDNGKQLITGAIKDDSQCCTTTSFSPSPLFSFFKKKRCDHQNDGLIVPTSTNDILHSSLWKKRKKTVQKQVAVHLQLKIANETYANTGGSLKLASPCFCSRQRTASSCSHS